MGFKDCNEMFGPGLFLQLRNDQDSVDLVLVDEPRSRETEFRGKPRKQAMFPVATTDGLLLWTVGSRLYHKIEASWKEFFKKPIRVTRHGAANDPQTVYIIERIPATSKLTASVRSAKPLEIEALYTALEEYTKQGEGTDSEEPPI